EGTNPTLGSPGTFERVEEARFEIIVPRHRLARVTRAYVAAHPYEVPAFDVLDLQVPAGVGFGRVGRVGAGGGAAAWTALGVLDPELLAYGAPDKVPAGAGAAVHIGAVRDVFDALLDEEQLGLVVACSATDAEIDALTELGASVLLVDRARAVGAFADQLAGMLSRALTLPVSVAAGLRFPDSTSSDAGVRDDVAAASIFGDASPATPAATGDFATGTWRLQFDGGSRGNPGPASYGWVLYDPDGNEAVVSGVRVGKATNNVAEWTGLLRGLERAAELGVRDLDVRGDSELIIKQFNGVYKVKNADLKPIAEAAKALARRFDRLRVSHVYRADNSRADELANEAMDGLRNE
ncbi:MAG: bifunctional RNase H/acid phosphatase, partial [Thermoleophilia bacterium]|nr:bifunctional RNase H/acid phosphatase [Thermoleophilia bacterium]